MVRITNTNHRAREYQGNGQIKKNAHRLEEKVVTKATSTAQTKQNAKHNVLSFFQRMWRTSAYIKCVVTDASAGMFTVYFHTKYHMSVCDSSLVAVNKTENKETSHGHHVTILYRKQLLTLINFHVIWRFSNTHHFRTLQWAQLSFSPTPKLTDLMNLQSASKGINVKRICVKIKEVIPKLQKTIRVPMHSRRHAQVQMNDALINLRH